MYNLLMITIWCSAVTGGKTIKQIKLTSDAEDMNEGFLECMTKACKQFDIEMPMWHSKHTKQLNMFRKITFVQDDFIDRLPCDRFVVEITDFS